MNKEEARHFQSMCRHYREYMQTFYNRMKMFEEGPLSSLQQMPIEVAREYCDSELPHMIKELNQVTRDMRGDLDRQGE